MTQSQKLMKVLNFGTLESLEVTDPLYSMNKNDIENGMSQWCFRSYDCIAEIETVSQISNNVFTLIDYLIKNHLK